MQTQNLRDIKHFFLLILVVVFISGCVEKKDITKEQLEKKFSDINNIYNEKKANGYNLSVVDSLIEDARTSYEKNDYKHTSDLLNQAFKELERVKLNETSNELINSTTKSLQTSNIPPEYRKQVEEINSWLDKKIIDWTPQKYNKMEFIGIVPPSVTERSTNDIIYKYIDFLESAEVDTIAIYLSQTWTLQEQKYYDIFNKIKKDNKKLYIVFQATPVKKMSWDEYVNSELTTIDKVIPVYKPDYFGIVNEPETNIKNAGLGDVSVSDWKTLIVESANKIKKDNPSTKTIITTSKNQSEVNIIYSAMTVSGIDIIGLNNYGPKMDIFDEVISAAHNNNREVWITETWINWKDNDKEWLEEINNKWMVAMVYYSQQKNISAVAPFFTRYFLTYTNNADLGNELPIALENKTRTSTYYKYISVIKEIKSKSS